MKTDEKENSGLKSKLLKNRTPLTWSVKNIVIGFIGGFITIFLLSFLDDFSVLTWFMAPFGASCVLAYAAWESPLSQPRNIIGGHFIATLVGLIVLHTLGSSHLAIGLAVGLAIAATMITKTVHPPAGADPIIVILAGSSWSFLLTPVLLGSVIIVILAIIINRLFKRDYPKFWI